LGYSESAGGDVTKLDYINMPHLYIFYVRFVTCLFKAWFQQDDVYFVCEDEVYFVCEDDVYFVCVL
jgi:hypothetical protein